MKIRQLASIIVGGLVSTTLWAQVGKESAAGLPADGRYQFALAGGAEKKLMPEWLASGSWGGAGLAVPGRQEDIRGEISRASMDHRSAARGILRLAGGPKKLLDNRLLFWRGDSTE